MSAQHNDPTQPATPETADSPAQSGAADQRQDGPGSGATSDDPATLRSLLEEANRKADEYLDLAKRTRADFTNYRRRMEEERAQLVKDAGLDVIMRLLPILDDFERALANARPEDMQSEWAKGVQLIERNLRSMLASQDVQRIEADGAAFNPWEHEAISYHPTQDAEEGHVLHVVRPGYKKGERVIRPAQVVVAGRPQ